MSNRLKAAREAVKPKLSLRAAAEALGVGPSTIYRQELADFDPANLSVAELEARAEAYGCTVGDLLGRPIRYLRVEQVAALADDFATA
jgi:hypothetical protein